MSAINRRPDIGAPHGTFRLATEYPHPNSRHWMYLPLSYLCFWVLGVGFIWWVVVPPVVYAATKPRMPKLGVLPLLLSIVLLGSLTVNFIGGAARSDHVAGAAYSVLFWLATALLLAVISERAVSEQYWILRGLIIVGGVGGLIGLAGRVVGPRGLESVLLPVGHLLTDRYGFSAWTRLMLYEPTWFNGPAYRSAGLQAEAAWSGGFSLVILAICVLKYEWLRQNGMKKCVWLCLSALNGVAIVLSYSRLSIMMMIILVAAVLARLIAKAGILLVWQIGLALTLLVANFQSITHTLQYINEARAGSADARLLSYVGGLSALSDAPAASWIVGLGAKPFTTSMGYGAGSESTLVSLLVRGGILAVALFVTFGCASIVVAKRRARFDQSILLIIVLTHALIEDLDIGTLTIFAWFAAICVGADATRSIDNAVITPRIINRVVSFGSVHKSIAMQPLPGRCRNQYPLGDDAQGPTLWFDRELGTMSGPAPRARLRRLGRT